MAQVTLCLTMIVRNEQDNMERCLDSVRDLCDFMVVCDTGSTDQTCDVVLTYFAKHKVRGWLWKHEWKNFGHNRTLSMDAARDTGATYALTIDADMVVCAQSSFDKQALLLDAYTVVQRDESLYYANQRIHRLALPWKSVGVTHEYWSCGAAAAVKTGALDTLVIEDVGDGGCKADKFTRDLALLTAGLQDEPGNTRYLFYLAQTHYALEAYAAAWECYEQRSRRGGWDQEVWYAKYMMGKCQQKMGNWPRAHEAYLDAWRAMPSRCEPLYQVVRHHRQQGEHVDAYKLCLTALEVPFPTPSPLFCDIFIYVSGLYFELSMVAYHAGDLFRGMLACEKIIHNCLPWQEHAGDGGLLGDKDVRLTMQNRLYYMKPLPMLSHMRIDAPTKPGWHWCNPFPVALDQDTYLVVVRCVNYTLRDGQYHHPATGVETENFVTQVKNNAVGHHIALVRDTAQSIKFPSQVRGYEDMRLVRCKDTWYGVATSREMNQESKAEMVLLTMQDTHIARVVRLRGHQDHLHQKNWMPFVWRDDLLLVYMCDPLTILKADRDSGCVSVVHEQESDSWDMSSYRGSSNGVVWGDDDTFLFIVHEVVDGPGRTRSYTHRFVLVKAGAWEVVKISQPFYFFLQGVEFVTGITLMGDTLCIGVGRQDCEAHLVHVDPSQVNRWLTHGELLFHSL